MLELPLGVITEKRRGGPSVLSLLAKDIIGAKVDSYIRSELELKNKKTRVGYVIFRNGSPLMAMHAEQKTLHAANALEQIDDDAAELDCLLTVHRNIDVDLLLQTFPSSLLNLELDLDSESNTEWWKQKEITSKTWTSSKALPEQKFDTNNTPEFERAIEARLRRLKGGDSSELYPGHAYLISDGNPSNSFKLASKLSNIEHQLMIISRIPNKRISEEYNLPINMCYWLTEKTTKEGQTIGPQLELLHSNIKEFFADNPRSVVVLDGFEFLYAIHGRDRTLDFLRRLVDIATTCDDLAFIPINLDAFDTRSRALIKRELDLLKTETIEDWLISPEDLEGHLFHLPDQQEIQWDEELSAKKPPLKKEISQSEKTPTLSELVDSEKIQKRDLNNEGSRLDLSGIIETWDKEDAITNPEITQTSDVNSEILPLEDKELEKKKSKKGPKKPTTVTRLGIKQKTNSKKIANNKKSSLKQATKITKEKEKKNPTNEKWKKKDESRTYRHYYDASKHKGKTGGED